MRSEVVIVFVGEGVEMGDTHRLVIEHLVSLVTRAPQHARLLRGLLVLVEDETGEIEVGQFDIDVIDRHDGRVGGGQKERRIGNYFQSVSLGG